MMRTEAGDLFGEALGRFRLVRRIGAGAMGVVYEATDPVQGQSVALKTLSHLEPEAIYRLKREFRSLAGVLHPNLVHMRELASDGRHWFFVMDYVEGCNFLDYVRGVRQPPDERLISDVAVRTQISRGSLEGSVRLPGRAFAPPAALEARASAELVQRLRACLGGLLSGVLSLHAMGKLHRDLKPSNVLVTGEGRVVILDFGLTSDTVRGTDSDEEKGPRGTPLYMAPELFLGEPVSEKADFYAIGVMLYEVLVGHAPFNEISHQLVAQKLYGEIPLPHDLVAAAPRDLSELSVALLHRDPKLRPGAEELALRFQLPTRLRRTGAEPPGSGGSRPPSSTFIGRKPELSQLQTALEQVDCRHSMLNCICGESGLGKTALIDQFLSTLPPEDTLIFRGRCYEHESVPYKAFDQIADHLSAFLSRLDEQELARFVPQEAGLLSTVFPVLARIAPFRQGGEGVAPADPTELRLRGLSAFRELLARIAESARVILVIDDLQWADDDSAFVFDTVFAGAAPPPCLVLMTSRVSPPATLDRLRRNLQASRGGLATLDFLSLSGLSQEESLELARQGASTQERSTLARYISDEARGNPFFVLALARNTKGATAATSLPSMMQDWLLALPERALRLLRVIAVAGRPLPEATLLSVLGTNDVSAELFSLSAEHYLGAWPTPNRLVECYHDRIRETVLDSLTEAELRGLHAELGEVQEALGGADAEVLATHFLAAGIMDKGSRYAERAADEATTALAFFHSAHWYKRALQGALDDSERRAILLRKLGEAHAGAGQGVAAAEHLLEAAALSDQQRALKLKQRAAELQLVCGHIDAGVRTLEDVLTHIKMRLAPTPKRALLSLITQRARARVRGHSFVPRKLSEIPEDALLKIDACWSVALGLSLVDPMVAADFQTRNLLLSLDAGDPYRVARALAMEAGFVATGGSRSEKKARRLSTRARALASQVGSQHAIGLSTFTAGLGRYLVGDWPTAIRLFSEAEGLLQEVPGAIWELNASQRFCLHSQVFRGDLHGLSERVPELLRSARERGNLYAECNLRVRGTTVLCLMDDAPDQAEAETEDVMVRWSQEGFHLQHYSALCARLQCDLYRGDVVTAMDRIKQTWPKLEASLLTNTQAVRVESKHLRTRTCLAYLSAYPDDRATQDLLRSDVRSLRREKVAWASAFATFAEALGATNSNPERAQAGLLASEGQFASLGMELFAQVSRSRRGHLLGGEEGAALVTECRHFLKNQGVKHPERYERQLGPLPGSRSH